MTIALPNTGTVLNYTITMVFAFLVPLAILAGRFAVKRQRQNYLLDLLRTFQEATGADVQLIPPFEYALHKYDLTGEPPRRPFLAEFAYFSSTALIFALISWAGFAFVLLFATTS